MDRLVGRFGPAGMVDYDKSTTTERDILEKLFAYEDTGLIPEEIKTMQFKQAYSKDAAIADHYMNIGLSMERLDALAEADRDGRCVVLPCKVGEHLQIQKSLYVVEGFLCNKIGAWKVHLVREIPEWIGNQQKHYYMSFRMFEKKRTEAEAALGKEQKE